METHHLCHCHRRAHLIAPYSGDATWDWIDANFMAVLTFATAPFSVGAHLPESPRFGERSARLSWAPVLGCFRRVGAMTSNLLLRDGTYPVSPGTRTSPQARSCICARGSCGLSNISLAAGDLRFPTRRLALASAPHPVHGALVGHYALSSSFIVIVAVALLSFLRSALSWPPAPPDPQRTLRARTGSDSASFPVDAEERYLVSWA